MDHAIAMIKAARRACRPTIEDAGPEGERGARRRSGKPLYDLNVQQYCCGGLNFGYFYDRSPIIAYDGEAPPPYTMDDFTPSTVPGCRTPHFWLRDGRSLYDAMGPDYTLLRFDPAVDVSPAARRGGARAACRSRCSTSRRTRRPGSTARSWCSRVPTSTSPGAATRARRSARLDRPHPRRRAALRALSEHAFLALVAT